MLPRVFAVCRIKIEVGMFEEWFWVGSCFSKVHGRLPDCCNPTLTSPSGQQFSPVSWQVHNPHGCPTDRHTHTRETADPVVHFTHVCNWELSASPKGGWPRRHTLGSMEGGEQWVWGLRCVSQESAPLFYLSGRRCVFVLVRLRVELSSCFHGQPGCRGYCQL